MKRSLLGLSLLLFSLMSLFSAEAKKPVTDPRQAAIVEKILDSGHERLSAQAEEFYRQRLYDSCLRGYAADGSSLCRSKLPGSVGSRRGHELQRCADYQLPSEKNEAGQLGDYFFRPDEYRVVLVHVPHRTERPDERFPRSRELREHHLQRRSICPKRSGFLIARGFSGCGIVFVARPHAGSYRRSGAAFPVSLACRRANHSVFRLCALLYRPSSSRCFRA